MPETSEGQLSVEIIVDTHDSLHQMTSGYLLQCRRTFASVQIFQFYHTVANKQNDEQKSQQNNFLTRPARNLSNFTI